MRWWILVGMLLAGAARSDAGCTIDDQHGCRTLAIAYSSPDWPPFPNDTQVAKGLVDALFHIQQDACQANDYSACLDMLESLHRHPARDFRDEPDPDIVQDAITLAIKVTEAGCDRGEVLACLNRSVLHPEMASASFPFGFDDAQRTLFKLDYTMFQLAAAGGFSDRISESDAKCRAGDERSCEILIDLIQSWHLSKKAAALYGLDSQSTLPALDPLKLLAPLVAGCQNAGPATCRALTDLVERNIHTLRESRDPGPFLSMQSELSTKCDAGIGAACFVLGVLAATADDAEDADLYLLRACKIGHPDGCLTYGMQLYQGFLRTGRVADLQSVSDVMSTACNADRIMACHFLTHLSRQ